MIEGTAVAVFELRAAACDPVCKEIGLQAQPQPLNRVEVRAVRRQEQGFKVVPSEGFDLVPGGVVEHQHPAQPLLWRYAERKFVKPALKTTLCRHLQTGG